MTKISTTDQKVNTKKFENNFEAIFGKDKPVVRGSFIQTEDGIVPRGTANFTPRYEGSAAVLKPHEAFRSPIDGKMIESRKQLAEHNKRHGVTNSADYSGGYIERKAHERNRKGQEYLEQTRRSDIHEAISKFT